MKRKLYKVRKGKIVAGVCGGIAKYFDVSVFFIRLLFAAFILAFGSGLMVYIILALFLPKEPR